ncbi:MAG: GNAT family N-acetyltransferase [Pseudomonadota bacterium]
MTIRPAKSADHKALWDMLRPVFRAGETYAVKRDISRGAALELWCAAPRATYVMEEQGKLLGTYYIKTNAQGGGAHVCNCGYITAPEARGKGVARAMCERSQQQAVTLGYKAMQFNMVLASNSGALALWQRLGFETVGHLPRVFDHPRDGLVDGHVMYKWLGQDDPQDDQHQPKA